MKGKFIKIDGTFSVDTGTTGMLDTAADAKVFDVRDLTEISVYVDQLVDAGTCTILVEKSIDGTNWALAQSLAESDFPAGANKSKEVTLSDANGMATSAVQVRVTLSVVGGGGHYDAHVAGTQRPEYR